MYIYNIYICIYTVKKKKIFWRFFHFGFLSFIARDILIQLNDPWGQRSSFIDVPIKLRT